MKNEKGKGKKGRDSHGGTGCPADSLHGGHGEEESTNSLNWASSLNFSSITLRLPPVSLGLTFTTTTFPGALLRLKPSRGVRLDGVY